MSNVLMADLQTILSLLELDSEADPSCFMIETDHNKYYELNIYCIWISYWIEILTSAKIHLTLIENYSLILLIFKVPNFSKSFFLFWLCDISIVCVVMLQGQLTPSK